MWASAGCAAALGFVAQRAEAKQEYYDAIVMQTSTCADCRLCHSTPVGSLLTLDVGNPQKPFATTWYGSGRPRPLPDGDADADRDGFSDLAELMGMGDPNDPAIGPGQFECPVGAEPEFGCARIAQRAPRTDDWSLALGFAVALLIARRRR
jgi:hypothetical protein